MNGTDLLAEFRERRSEEAFRALVLRYTNLVYSVARRRVSNASLAEEITQIVFIRLAKAVPKLGSEAELAAWLHRTTVHASIDLWRSESRRRAREQHAVAMQTDPHESVPWNDLAPVLDDAVNDLNDADRQAVVLRFFNDQSMRDVGARLGVSEDAAKMRISRALEKLRGLLGTRGVSCGALALGAMLAERGVEAAPAHLAASLAALKLPARAAGISTGALVGSIASLLLLGTAVWFWLPRKTVITPVVAQPEAAAVNSEAQASSAIGDEAAAPTASGDPDPLRLLQAVARARERITSGVMEFQGYIEHTHSGRKETNHMRLVAAFDGQKLRLESVRREYAYVGVGKEGEASKAKVEQLGLDNEAAVRAGLSEAFESHHVVANDGSVVMDYWESNKGTSITDPTNSPIGYIFDPRTLGLSYSPFRARGLAEEFVAYKHAKSIKLVGKELVGDRLAWHVNVLTEYDMSLHYWMDVEYPTHVVKFSFGADTVLSKYDGSSPLPAEVVVIDHRKCMVRISQLSAQFNVAVDATNFSLAGLGMKVGTPVSDDRNMRQVGYWTGSGLSPELPRKDAKTSEAPKMSELMALLEQNPTSHFALQAAIWIILNTPDGPEVEKAAEVILQEHIESPELFELCKEQDRVRHRSSRKLLEALLEQNPNADIKAMACYNLAVFAKEKAKHGLNQEATAEADKLFDRVIRDFPKFNQVHNAKRELTELRRMAIGNPAPPLEGVDLDGNPLRLSDYRGKVVLVYFWGPRYYDHSEEHEKLLASMAGKPFAILGVNDGEKPEIGKAIVEKRKITWPSFWDGRYWTGTIHSNWMVRYWPATYILDQNHVIRYRDLRWHGELEKAVNSLLP